MKRKREGLLSHSKGSQLNLLDLPSEILCSIISRLEIKDAIRTSVLSSRCRYLWCNHTKLVLNCNTLRNGYEGRPMDLPDFITKVDAILEQHSGVGVNVLDVHAPFLRNMHAKFIDKWVRFAVESRAKELCLRLSDKYTPVDVALEYNFPCHLFNTGTYVWSLDLSSVSLNLRPPDNINGFLNLRKLRLVDVSITDEHIEHLLSNCALLEFLEIIYCTSLTSIHASSMNRLKHLSIHNCYLLQRIEINCALITLEYSGMLVPIEFTTVSRLRNVQMNLEPMDTNILDYLTTAFPSSLPNLETFSLECKQCEGAIFPVRPIKFMYLRHLSLEVFIQDKCHGKPTAILDYAYLLNIVPFLEELELHMWMRSFRRPYRKLVSQTLHSHKHTHLKSVYFTGFFGYEDQVKLALHILHSSAVLQSMKIDPAVKSLPEVYENLNYTYGRRIATEIILKADRNNIVQVVGPPSPTKN